MRPQMWKRLDRIEQSVSLRKAQIVSVIQGVGETEEEVEDRISRWKAGDTDCGIKGKYEGRELDVIWVRIVSPKCTERRQRR